MDKQEIIDPIVPVEEPPSEVVVAPAKSGLAMASGGNMKVMIVVVSLISSVLIYFFLFSSSEEEVIDNRQIIRDEKGTGAISRKDLEEVSNLSNLVTIDSGGTGSETDNTINEQLLELPTLPALPESVRANIEEEIQEIKKQKEGGDTFTKEEVDDMINERLIAFEVEMRKVRNESERLAKEIQKQKILDEEERKKAKKNVLPSILTSPSLDPLSPESIFSAEELQKTEEEKRELQRAQRAKIMEERKGASMFKMQGGGGGDSTLSIDQNSIIITDRDSLDTVADTTTSVTPTKLPDLSRTLIQGKIINAILETAINTDINTPIRAIISRDIYSESNKNILIPKGSKLIGNFQATGLSSGVSRINITWSRLIRVDGLSIDLSTNTVDDLGRGGIEGELDNKYAQTIRNSLLSSVVQIASSLLVEKISGSVGITNSTVVNSDGSSNPVIQTSGKVSDYAIVEATQNIADEMQNIIDSIKEEKPTIRVAQGTRLNVVVNQDMTLPIYKQNK